MPLGVPDGPGTGLASPLVSHTVPSRPESASIGLQRDLSPAVKAIMQIFNLTQFLGLGGRPCPLGVPDGPGTGLASPLVSHTVPQSPGVGLDRPAAGYYPRSESNHANIQPDTVSWIGWSAMPLGGP